MIVANTQVTDCASRSSPALINRKSLTPLARIDLRAGKPPEYGRAVADAVHNAMIATLNAPKDDRFHVISEVTLPFHDQKDRLNFIWDPEHIKTLHRKIRGLRHDYGSGHGIGNTRAQQICRSTDVLAFMLWQFGDPEFQPSKPKS
jgi:hypothetical protein